MTRINLVRTINAEGGASAPLPAAAGTNATTPPAMACYMTEDGQVWSAVNDGYSDTSAYCGLVFANGVWNAVMVQGVAGWFAGFVIVY